MYYLKDTPNSMGAYPAPQGHRGPNTIPISEDQKNIVVQYNGFVTVEVSTDEAGADYVTIEPNIKLWESWKDENYKSELDSAKKGKIQQSNDLLDIFLATHPITWVDGNKYSVTEEKQNLLTSNIALYQLSVQAGTPRELKWNTTGDVCTVWTIENLSALALAIGDYVQPYVTYQQTVEVQIKECTTMEELEAIVIDYSTVSTVEPEVITDEQGS